MMLSEVLAGGAGFGSGLIAAWLADRCSRRLGDNGFWQQLAAVSRLLLSSESEAQIVREQLRLWQMLFVFVVKRLLAVVLALVPVLLTYGCLANFVRGESNWELVFLITVCVSSISGMLVLKLLRPAYSKNEG